MCINYYRFTTPLHTTQRVMRALDKTWHPEHFFCTLCGKHFGPEGFHEKDSKAFCRECYYEKYAPRCKRCDRAIMEGFITAMNSQWHPECFSCKVRGRVISCTVLPLNVDSNKDTRTL